MFCCHVSINRFGSEVRAPYAGNGPQIRLKRHEYFDVLYLCSGSAICHVLDRSLPFEEGDLAVIGSGPHIECRTSTPRRITALFFDPDLIRCDGDGGGAEYLAPFLLQDAEFPHVVPAKAGIPNQVLELMLRIQLELPASCPRACLAVRTYLKMLLMLLVNHYAAYARTLEIFQQHQRAVERLCPVLQYLSKNGGSAIRVGDAAKMCGMHPTSQPRVLPVQSSRTSLRRPSTERMAAAARISGVSLRGLPRAAHFTIENEQEVPHSEAEGIVRVTAGARLPGNATLRMYDLPTNNNGNLLEPSGGIG